jgi:3-hydroxyacyl-CoA dehydrogenase
VAVVRHFGGRRVIARFASFFSQEALMLPKRVAVVGCGQIGAGWAAYFLSRGLHVSCTDPAAGAESRLLATVRTDLASIGLGDEQIGEAVQRLSFTAQLEHALEASEWVQENAPENWALKREVIRSIDAASPASVIIASSTSGIMPSQLQVGLKHPERVIAGHPFLPVPLIGLVEVVGGSLTSAVTIDAAMAFYTSIGKVPIRVRREVVGHVANRLQAALMREAFFLLDHGVASAAEIDLAITEGPGQRWAATGPLISHDLAGGAGGGAAAFANLGDSLRAMWADLGSPSLDDELEAKILSGIAEILAKTPGSVWLERRAQVLHCLAQIKFKQVSS